MEPPHGFVVTWKLIYRLLNPSKIDKHDATHIQVSVRQYEAC